MLKVKNLFMMMLLTLSVGLLMSACEETTSVQGEYKISVVGGTVKLLGESGGSTYLYADSGKLVILTAVVPAGSEFVRWNVSPSWAASHFLLAGTSLDDITNGTNAWFYMPDNDVTVTAVFNNGEPDAYTISTIGGTMEWWKDPTGDPQGNETETLSNGDLLYENDVVIILSADPPAGKVFAQWNVSPASAVDRFYDRYDPNTTFLMPAANVTITAVFEDETVDFVDGLASVRFTWEATENERITHISASVEDLEWWYEEVYADLENSDADFTDLPLFDGNPGVTEKIFNFGGDSHPNKGKYWNTEAGVFTAVCGVEDEYGLAEIVANYAIVVDSATSTANGQDLYWEIAFDVGTFLSEPGMDDEAWFQDVTLDPSDPPRLEKKIRRVGVKKIATKQLKKAGATFDVTYYLIRRPNV